MKPLGFCMVRGSPVLGSQAGRFWRYFVTLYCAGAFGVHAQNMDVAVSGFSVAPPMGYVASGAPSSPSRFVVKLTKPAEPGTRCEASFEALPGFEHFSQEALNRQADNPGWDVFYREGLGDFYTVTNVERFDHAGVSGALVSGTSKPRQAVRDWIARQPTLIFMLYTPKSLSMVVCVAQEAMFSARRSEFEAVARGLTPPR